MATLTTTTAKPMARFDQASAGGIRGTRYTLRSDGVILRQFRYEGKLEAPAVSARWKRETWRKCTEAMKLAAFKRYAAARGVREITIL